MFLEQYLLELWMLLKVAHNMSLISKYQEISAVVISLNFIQPQKSTVLKLAQWESIRILKLKLAIYLHFSVNNLQTDSAKKNKAELTPI